MSKRILFYTGVTIALGTITYMQLFGPLHNSPEPAESTLQKNTLSQNIEKKHQPAPLPTMRQQVLPKPAIEDVETPAQMTLWSRNLEPTDSGTERHYKTRIDPQQLNQFRVGQTLTFTTPENTAPLNVEITKTYNQGRFAKVWNASDNGNIEESLTITQGKIETHMIIVSAGKVFTAIIDNATGDTVIIDQADLADKATAFEDGIPLPVEETELPTL